MSQRSNVEADESTASAVGALIIEVVSTVAAVVMVFAWVGFWLNVVRLNNSFGNTIGAMLTIAVLIAPMVAFLVWYLGSKLGFETMALDLDITETSS
jgi:hypothetical protein